MRIGFDCAKLVKGNGNSIGIYNVTKYVLSRLADQMPAGHTVVVIGNESNRVDFERDNIEFHPVELDVSSKKALLMWELFGVNSYIKKYNLDEIVFPRGFTSLFCPVKDVVIIHDLIPVFYEEHFPGVLGKYKNKYIVARLISSIRTADKIITISDYSKKDIVKNVPKAADKVEVILHGYESNDRPDYKHPEEYGDYFFAITSQRLPHKNPVAVIKSYMEYYKMSAAPIDLVLSGVKDLSALGVDIPEDIVSHIHCTGFLSDDAFYSVFKFAKAFVFLSLIEGFGLPPLEAMELKVPVICSDRTSLPEVVRDAGVLVNPDDYKAVAAAMKNIAEDKTVADQYIKLGVKNLENFNWEKQVDEYVRVLLK